MQSKQRLLALAVAALMSSAATQGALAQESAGAGAYFGIGLGQGDSDLSGHDSDTSLQIYGGYMYNQNFGVEGGYAKYGDFEGPAGNFEADGLYLAGVGRYPISDNVSLVGKLGFVHYGFESTVGGTSSGDGSGTMVGIGVDYHYSDAVSIGAEYDMISGIEDTDASALWVNVTVGMEGL